MGARIATAAIGIPLVLYAIGAGSLWPLAAFLVGVAVLATIEFARLERINLWIAAVVGVGLGATFAFWRPAEPASPWLLAVYLVPAIEAARKDAPRLLLLGLWILLPLLSAYTLRAHALPIDTGWGFAPEGNALLLTVLCLWAGDTAAYFIGKAIGRHKLAPSVSPAKTWEGAAANLVACLATGYFVAEPLHIQPMFGLALGGACGVLGQLGDLFQSLWKRRHGVKDSGGLLPGHGGMLDRFDSLLFCLPAANALAFWWSR